MVLKQTQTPGAIINGNGNRTKIPEVENIRELRLLSKSAHKEVLLAGTAYMRHSNGSGFVAQSATVDENAYVDITAVVLCDAVVGPWAKIGENTIIDTGAIVGFDAKIGRDCTIRPYAIVEDRAVVKDGTAITSDTRTRGIYALKRMSFGRPSPTALTALRRPSEPSGPPKAHSTVP